MDEAAAQYMALVEALVAASKDLSPPLSPLGAGILAGLALDIASDSRSFARMLGVAHALVLREISLLGAEDGYIRITERDPRTQRTRYELNPAGQRLVDNI